MKTTTEDYFNAFGRYQELQVTRKATNSFFDHFSEKDTNEFQRFITVFWETEYPVKRSSYIFYFPFVNYRDSTDPYALSQDELESIIDFLVIFIFLTKEKNGMPLAFAQKEMVRFPSTLYQQAINYFMFSLTSAAKGCSNIYYLNELVEVLRGNRGIHNHYSHKKFNLKKEDYCPIR